MHTSIILPFDFLLIPCKNDRLDLILYLDFQANLNIFEYFEALLVFNVLKQTMRVIALTFRPIESIWRRNLSY